MRTLVVVIPFAVAGCFLDATGLADGSGSGAATSTSTTGGHENVGGAPVAGGGQGATGGSNETGGSGPEGGMGGSAGTGGSSSEPFCGDGTVDADEQCDDANDDAGDGCEGCLAVCPNPNATLNPANLHCYLFVATATSWDAARTTCESGGGYLVTITSQAENDFIASTFSIPVGGVWIGASDTAAEGTFEWAATGEPWGFEPWEPNEPSNGGTGEDCVEITAGAPFDWNDDVCTKDQRYVCERTLFP